MTSSFLIYCAREIIIVAESGEQLVKRRCQWMRVKVESKRLPLPCPE